MKSVDQPFSGAEADIGVRAPRLVHLVGSLPRPVARTELSAMQWILAHVALRPGRRDVDRPAVA